MLLYKNVDNTGPCFQKNCKCFQHNSGILTKLVAFFNQNSRPFLQKCEPFYLLLDLEWACMIKKSILTLRLVLASQLNRSTLYLRTAKPVNVNVHGRLKIRTPA